MWPFRGSWEALGLFEGLLEGSWSPLPSHRPWSILTQTGINWLHPHFSHLKLTSTSLNSTPLNSTHLNSLFDPPRRHFGASWPPKSTQDRLKSPLDTSFVQKREFSRNIGRRSVWSVSRAPRRPPRRPKIGPRRLQDDLQEHLFSTSFLTSILVPLGSHFGLILAPLGPPKGGCA